MGEVSLLSPGANSKLRGLGPEVNQLCTSMKKEGLVEKFQS